MELAVIKFIPEFSRERQENIDAYSEFVGELLLGLVEFGSNRAAFTLLQQLFARPFSPQSIELQVFCGDFGWIIPL
ncbi:hypothetical protein DAT35_02370 [Vitiosangium sp. GDMCC 1.1324]|nr:hypothetical protein DAT35_02370 [Vitiosangium sp. GDMCC 1.1324]